MRFPDVEDRRERDILIEYLSGFVTAGRLGRIDEVLSERTRHVTVVLENLFQPQNASAILRSCDCLGVQDLHVLEHDNRLKLKSGVTVGSDKWLSLHRYPKGDPKVTLECYARLRAEGYRVVATTPHEGGERCHDLETLPLDQPVAVVFGTELEGLTESAVSEADLYLKVPMRGFSESYNVSVTAALTLYRLTARLRESDTQWHLSEEDRLDLRLRWIRKSVRHVDQIEDRFRAEGGLEKACVRGGR